MKRLILGLAVILAACSDSTAPAITPSATATAAPAASLLRGTPRALTAMTQNMYVGADLDAVIGALASPDPGDDFPALMLAIQTLEATDYPARAGAFAREIARERPTVVGLQEVSQIDIDLNGFGIPTVIHLDFLSILADSLRGRGLHYTLAAKVQNIVAQPVPGIGLVDYDAMLVDADRVVVKSASGQNYSNNIGVVAPGIELKRGWVQARVLVGGESYVFASTHLESGDSPGLPELRAAQATELVAALPTNVPALVLGDFNDTPDSPAHDVLRGAHLTDTWAALRGREPGLTCCEQPDLSNPQPVFDQRIDYIWARGFGAIRGEIHRIGDQPGSRVQGPLGAIWPSDHAGLVLEFRP